MAALQIIFGLVLLAVGGDILVRGAVGVAQRLKVSALVTGLVLVGFGTSMPELVTSLNAVLKGSPDIALGNVVGSNIANILLILGLAAVLSPITADLKAIRRDGPMVAFAALLCAGITLFWTFGRPVGAAFVAILITYIVTTYRVERRAFDAQAELHVREAEIATPHAQALWLSTLFTLGGIALLIIGADRMVTGSISAARALGIPEMIIGLTIVAVGTSLPELATSVVAAMRKQSDIALGNILGSNIFNIVGILGVTALVKPFAVDPARVSADLWIMLGVTALLLLLVVRNARLAWRTGALFLLLYAGYAGLLAQRALAGP